MRIKSYFTNVVESAVALARVELGPDALLISVRRTGAEAKALGRYEVVFGVATENSTPSPTGPAPGAAPIENPMRAERPNNLRLHSEERRTEWAEPCSAAQRSMEYLALVEAHVDRTLAEEITGSVRTRLAREENRRTATGPVLVKGRNEVQDALLAEIEARFEVGPLTSTDGLGVAALIGPHGAGKTTTLVKLAVIQGLSLGRRVEIISLDTNRVGATEILRSYAGVLNAGFYPLDNPALLPHAIQDLKDRNTLILIDTPGCGAEGTSAPNLLAALSRYKEAESHLVLPATMSDCELRRTVDLFAMFRPATLIFTRIDETVGFGRILTQAARTKTPLSFFGSGPEIPEDLEAVTKRGLVDRIISSYREGVLSAA